MNKEWDQRTENILDLTLEIIHLLTGEEYTVMKNPYEYVDHSRNLKVLQGSCSTQIDRNIPPPHKLISERKNVKKILELTHRILSLLTGEVPIRCEDVTVHLSMEEWEYVKRHKELYEDVMIEHEQTLDFLVTRSSSDGLHTSIPFPNVRIKNEILKKNGNRRPDPKVREPSKRKTVPSVSSEYLMCRDQQYTHTDYSSTHIKEETNSSDGGGDLSDVDIYPLVEHTQTEYQSPDTKEESASRDGGDLSDIDIYPFPDITEESALRDGGDLSNTDIYPPEEHTRTECKSFIKEELASSEENFMDRNIYTQAGFTSTSLKDELVPCEGNFTDLDIYIQTGYLSTAIKEDPVMFEGGDLLGAHSPNSYGDVSFTCIEGNNKTLEIKSAMFLTENRTSDKLPQSARKAIDSSSEHLRRFTGHSELFSAQSDQGKVFLSQSDPLLSETIPKQDKRFSCSECGKNFTQASYLVIHQRIHTGEQPFSCSECGKCFNQKPSLIRHQRIHTGEKPFKCADCGKCFTLKHNLITHQKIHTGEKPFKCNECGKCFTRATHLASHKRIHTGEKRLFCPETGKYFNVTQQKIPTAEKPLKCTECGKCFTRAAHLASHRRSHTKAKTFICPEWGQNSSDGSSLTHQGVHTEEKSFSCSECGGRFPDWFSYMEHMRSHVG